MGTNKDERTLGEMFAELSRETRTLVQQELQLAKTELTEKASKMGKSAAFIVGGGVIAYAGLLAIVAALVLILIAIGLPPWAAAISRRSARGRLRLSVHSVWACRAEGAGTSPAKDDCNTKGGFAMAQGSAK